MRLQQYILWALTNQSNTSSLQVVFSVLALQTALVAFLSTTVMSFAHMSFTEPAV
jgi:hypothetical protein